MFEAWMRPLVDGVQTLPPGIVHFAYPQTRLGLAARGLADKLMTSRPLRSLTAKFTQVAGTDTPLPTIPA